MQDPVLRKKMFDVMSVNGKGRPFLGKKHTTDSLKIIKEKRNLRDKSIYTNDEFKKKISDATKGKGNAMFGKTVYGRWVALYGVNKASELNIIKNAKISVATKGEKNPMFGRPSPMGSGVGWKGYYKDLYFRSLRELSYLIYLFDNNIEFISAESLSVPYKSWNGSNRTYRPDFILTKDRHVVEIKPSKLFNTPINLLKKEALMLWCDVNNYTCSIIDVPISTGRIKDLFISGKINFDARYLAKVNAYYGL